MIRHVWQPKESRRTISLRINTSLWKEFQKRTKELNCRYESDLLQYILERALFPKSKLYKLICGEMVEQFDYFRELKEQAERYEQIDGKEAQETIIKTN